MMDVYVIAPWCLSLFFIIDVENFNGSAMIFPRFFHNIINLQPTLAYILTLYTFPWFPFFQNSYAVFLVSKKYWVALNYFLSRQDIILRFIWFLCSCHIICLILLSSSHNCDVSQSSCSCHVHIQCSYLLHV